MPTIHGKTYDIWKLPTGKALIVHVGEDSDGAVDLWKLDKSANWLRPGSGVFECDMYHESTEAAQAFIESIEDQESIAESVFVSY